MAGPRRMIPAVVIGLVAGTLAGYCELMIRYHESGLGLVQFPVLLASRAVLGGIIGAFVGMRHKIPLGTATVIAVIGVVVPVEVLNWFFFGRG